MAQTTREKLLAVAHTLFSERGFYGVSIANIADKQGVTKQALLHHFASKEKLYGEVLQQISDEFGEKRAAAQASNDTPAAKLKHLLLGMIPETEEDYARARLLMRELLDNQERAQKAGTWYLGPLLKDLIKMTKAIPGWETEKEADALALVYQLLGAVNYYAISAPTLQGIFGAKTFNGLQEAFRPQLEAMIDAAVSIKSPGTSPARPNRLQ